MPQLPLSEQVALSFHYFLEVAAQTNGDMINTTNIAKDVGVDDKSIA